MKFFSRFGLTALTEQVTRAAFATVMLLTFQLISGQAIADHGCMLKGKFLY